MRRLIEPQCHEFTANLNFEGLYSWFALDSLVKEHDGSYETTTEALGETWDITLYYQDSAIQPPRSGETPAGNRIEHDEIREFRIQMTAQDETRQKKANFHVRPRWSGMLVEPDSGGTHELSVPRDLVADTDGVSVRCTGSNIEFSKYESLLRTAARAFGYCPDIFGRMKRHESSNVQDAAMYVRVNQDVSGPIHSRTGPLAGLAHVLESDRRGYRKLVQNDSNERGEARPGYYHTATLGLNRVREVMPSHELPVELKHYYARESHDKPSSDPLAHPKVEAAYQASRDNETFQFDSDSLDQLKTELTEWTYAILNDAGLDLRANDRVYVSDAYFDAENHTTEASVIDLDITEIRHEQEAIVYKQLVDMAPTDEDCLKTLVSDGGEVSPQDLAAETGRHQSSVYRSLSRLSGLIEHTRGRVSLKSSYLSELVADALQAAEDTVEKAVKTASKAANAESRGLDEETSAFIAWCEKYGVSHSNRHDDGDMHIRITDEVESFDEVKKILREGYRLWIAAGREAHVFRCADCSFEKTGTVPRRDSYLESRRDGKMFCDVWHVLK